VDAMAASDAKVTPFTLEAKVTPFALEDTVM